MFRGTVEPTEKERERERERRKMVDAFERQTICEHNEAKASTVHAATENTIFHIFSLRAARLRHVLAVRFQKGVRWHYRA